MKHHLEPHTALKGATDLQFRSSPVAILEMVEQGTSGFALGRMNHHAVGDRVAIAVSNGQHVFAALLTPAEVDAYCDRLKRAAAEVGTEGRA